MIGPLVLAGDYALLRPLALLALLPFGLWLALRRRRGDRGDESAWSRVIDPHLLPHLLATPRAAERSLGWLTPLPLLLAIVALSGPAIRDAAVESRILRPATSRLLLVDLSPSFAALPAERQALVRRKLNALLAELPPAETALAVHATEAYLVVPPTTDAATLARWLPELAAEAIPASTAPAAGGPVAALTLAGEVFSRAPNARHELIWLSARPDGELFAALKGGALPADAVVRILRLAETPGRPSGAVDAQLTSIALQADDTDLVALRAALPAARLDAASAGNAVTQQHDQWRDLGPLLLPALLGLAAAALWRRGGIVFAAALLLLPSGPVHSANRDDDPRWRAVAHYRAGDFAAAATLLESFTDTVSLYNRGNALAHLGRLHEALASYDAALRLRPGDDDIRHNRDLVARLLEPPPAAPPADAQRPPNPAANQDEAARAAEQWLRRVPDQPPSAGGDKDGGASLLQRKLALEAARRAKGAP